MKLSQIDNHLGKPQVGAFREEIPPEDSTRTNGAFDVRRLEQPLGDERLSIQDGGNYDRFHFLVCQVTRLREDDDSGWRAGDRKPFRLTGVVVLDDHKRTPLNEVSLVERLVLGRLADGIDAGSRTAGITGTSSGSVPGVAKPWNVPEGNGNSTQGPA